MSKAIRNVVPVHSTHNTPQYEIIIPAAGVGHRMKCYGAKPLLKLRYNLTILQYQLKMIRKHLPLNPQVILITGFQSNTVMNHAPQSVIKIENERYHTCNVLRSIGMGLRACTTNHIIIIYGDLVFNKYALRFPIEDESLIVTDTSKIMTDNEVGCNIINKQLQYMSYGLSPKWAQIVLLTGVELQLAKNICWNSNYFNHFGFELINEIMAQGGKFKVIQPYKIKVNDVDSPQDLNIARKII